MLNVPFKMIVEVPYKCYSIRPIFMASKSLSHVYKEIGTSCMLCVTDVM